jgi:hypothetical protein
VGSTGHARKRYVDELQSLLSAAPTPSTPAPRISESDTAYWIANRAAIIDAITAAGFELLSNKNGWWLSPKTSTPAPVARPVPWEDVIRAIRAVDVESARRGEMWPQTRDEQREDRRAMDRVCETIRFYATNARAGVEMFDGWPSTIAAPTPSMPAPVLCNCSGLGPCERRTDGSCRLAAPPTRPDVGEARTQAARDVLLERERQVTAEGWTPEHDDEHDMGEMAHAAAWYSVDQMMRSALDERGLSFWPWAQDRWKPTTPRRDLVKAGALILAEIERIDRAAPTPQGKE